jgi:hypothetical protein
MTSNLTLFLSGTASSRLLGVKDATTQEVRSSR